MKLLFFIHSLSSGGAERVTTTLANYWADKCLQVTIVTVTGKKNDFYKLNEAIERIPLELDQDSSNAFTGLFNNAKRLHALRSILKQVQPNVAISMMSTANCLLALAGNGLPLRTIGSERTYPPAMPLGRVWEGLRRWCYPRLDVLVAQTEQAADWLRKNAPARAVEVIPNPLKFPLDEHEPIVPPYKSSRADKDIKYTLLAVGRLATEKGFDRLLDAFASISEKHPQWRLLILGEGNLRRTLEQQIADLQLSETVNMPGSVGNVGEWYISADAYVLTSLSEGFPNTLVEAMAHGLPVVAVDCETGPRDIIRHKIDGLLVSQDDHLELCNALDLVMYREDLRKELSDRAIEVQQRFSVHSVANTWEPLFSDA